MPQSARPARATRAVRRRRTIGFMARTSPSARLAHGLCASSSLRSDSGAPVSRLEAGLRRWRPRDFEAVERLEQRVPFAVRLERKYEVGAHVLALLFRAVRDQEGERAVQD